MDNGCPKCKEIDKEWIASGNMYTPKGGLICNDCRLEQAEHDRDVAIKEWEELKKEKENADD